MDIARAWKDPQYRAGLPVAERESLPMHPAGEPGLERIDDAELEAIGGAGTAWIATLGCCNWYMTLTGGTTILPCTAIYICY
ncbi:mersacidin/lichenicidin family type 2 lantibiotic [Rhizomonospora bruguierae]|uniref:mersacidin/lichenicidin family type 2 lantibiotic n=1 Tax=Rhizomonospora bruguierae TaxID=1581705 RepID=UPI001BCE57C6|nr:mersacidin/lichenicidin family type 2 lantibiotic [Micromonospora sp. NBRC 107566]